MAQQTEPWNLTPRLPEIAAPVIVLLGTAPHEGALTPDEVEILRMGLREVAFREVAGAGHFIYEEQPGAVADAVRDMVRQLAGGGSWSDHVVLTPGGDGRTDPVQPGDTR